MNLSILCITRVEPFALPYLRKMAQLATDLGAEFVLAIDGQPQCGCDESVLQFNTPVLRRISVRSKGYLESVHAEALSYCQGDYVLRLDDDEYVSEPLEAWLRMTRDDGRPYYMAAPLWKFARAHRWLSPHLGEGYLMMPPLWPDHQTRLGEKSKMGGRDHIHAGSPYHATLAPFPIIHDKFVAKSLDERRKIVERYDRIAGGAGTNFAAFSVPEDVFDGVFVMRHQLPEVV